MPIYQYHDRRTPGKTVELYRPVDRRDDVPAHLERITVPERVGLFGSLSPLNPVGADASVPRAFREQELNGCDARRIERETGFSRDHIRRVWNF